MKLSQAAALLLLGAIWGASFSFINIAVQALHPLFLMFLRVLLAGLVLAGVAYFRQRQPTPKVALQLKTHWRQYLLVGLLNCALPFSLIAFSELRISVSVAAILNSTTPLFTAVIAASWVGEKLNGRKITGLFLGMTGVIILVGGGPLRLSGATAVGLITSLLGAMSYGAGAVYAARHMKHLPPLTASMVQLLSAALILAIPAAFQLPTSWPGTAVWLSLLALSLLSTCVAYLIFYALLQKVGASRTTSVTFLVPVFGTLWGVLFFHESLTGGMLLGMGTILASVGLVIGLKLGRPAHKSLSTTEGMG